jgi:hypothetical protein
MKKILLIGDSFAADWSIKNRSFPGWPNLLAEKYAVTNLAQAGCSEYKILAQLNSVDDLDMYDIVLVCHTSLYRVYTRQHPIHYTDALHKNADLMLNDLVYHQSKLKNFFNSSLRSAVNIFEKHFDQPYLEDIYRLIREKINAILQNKKVIVINNFEHLREFCSEKNVLDFSDEIKNNPGPVNHTTQEINLKIFHQLEQHINND